MAREGFSIGTTSLIIFSTTMFGLAPVLWCYRIEGLIIVATHVLVHLAIFALPLALFEIVFSKLGPQTKPWQRFLIGGYAGVVALCYQHWPLTLAGVHVDFKSIPILMSILYGSWMSGGLTVLVVLAGWMLFGLAIPTNPFVSHPSLVGVVTSTALFVFAVFAFPVSKRFLDLRPAKRITSAVILLSLCALVKVFFFQVLGLWGPGNHIFGFTSYVLAQILMMLANVLVVESLFRKSREREGLKHLNEAFLQAQEIGKIGSWEWIPSTGDFFASEQLKKLFAPLSLNHLTIESFVKTYMLAQDYPSFVSWNQKVHEGHEPAEMMCKVQMPDGSIRVMNLKGVAIRDSKENVKRLIGTTQDITDFHVMQQRMEESVERLKSIFERNIIGICEIDLHGTFLNVNSAYESLTGYSRDELVGKNRIMVWPENEHAKAQHLLEQAQEGNLAASVETSILHKAGTVIPVSTTNVPIIVEGKPVGFYGMVRDLREELAAEEVARQSEKLALAGQLAASVAHEIRNPLTAIKGFIQLMPKVDHDTLLRYKAIIDDELWNIERISSEMMMLAKPQVNDWSMSELGEILEHTFFLMEPQALMKSVVLDKDVTDNGPYPLYCISGQLNQVFINMIKNALEATPEGGRIAVRLNRQETNYVVEIKDTGHGIPEEVLPRLGEPFYTTKYEGTGLGLMVCHRIVDRHGGHISYKSSSQGTLVRITLPQSTADEAKTTEVQSAVAMEKAEFQV